MINYDKLTYTFIYEQYVIQRKSWRQIAKENNVSDTLLIYRARMYGITSRTVSQIRSEINNIDLNDILTSYAKGCSISLLAKQYKVSYSVMRDKLLSAGAVLRKSSSARSISNGQIDVWKWANRPWLTAAYTTASTTAIAKHVGCSRSLIRKSMILLGIQLRPNLGPLSGHDLSPIFPQFWYPNESEVREAFAANDLARFELTEAAETALCAYYSLANKNVPLQRTGPSFIQLSEASQRKWADPGYVNKVSKNNKLKYDDPEYARHIAEQRLKQRETISSIQQKLYAILDTIGIAYYREGPETIFGHYSFDCRIDNYHDDDNLLIEVQGDYWHNLERVVNNDRKKFTFITKYFPKFQLMYIWESEFDNIEMLTNKIKSKLCMLPEARFNFSELQIRIADNDEARQFLDAYHYIGGNRCGTAYAAFLDKEVAVMALLTSPTRQNMAARYGNVSILELARMCINPVYRKKNLASWFLSRIIKMVQCDKIIAFADSTVGHIGTIYKAANFKLDHRVSPDYWYTDGSCVCHKKTIYNRARALQISESEYANEFGYIKVFGGEKLAYVYTK